MKLVVLFFLGFQRLASGRVCSTAPVFPDGKCMQESYNDQNHPDTNLRCTANDVELAKLEVVSIIDACTGTDDMITFTAIPKIQANAGTRYDIGLFTSRAGESAKSGTGLTDCSVYGFKCDVANDEQDRADDGDYCGDITKGLTTFSEIEITAKCTPGTDADGTSGISLPYCFAWAQNANSACDANLAPVPGTPSKCTCDDLFVIPGVCVEGEIILGSDVNYPVADAECPATGTLGQSTVTFPTGKIISSETTVHYTVTVSGNTFSSGVCDVALACEILVSPGETNTITFSPVASGSSTPCNFPYVISPSCATSGGDPHLVGFKGQHFDFTGSSGGNYALLTVEPTTLLTMEVHAPLPELPVITYITGVGLTTEDVSGDIHTIQIVVDEPGEFHAHHECPTSEPCLAEGVLSVFLDGEPMISPGVVEMGPGVFIGAVNISGACRPFGFENYWAEKVRQAEAASANVGGPGSRRLLVQPKNMDEWILSDSAATNKEECAEYVKQAVAEDTLYTLEGEHALFQIVTPELTLRLNHGKLHQLPMRDPTNKFDLPDHRTYQMNLSINSALLGNSPQGVLGGTMRPTLDAFGEPIMEGPEAFVGSEEDYRVAGPFENDFALHLQAMK